MNARLMPAAAMREAGRTSIAKVPSDRISDMSAMAAASRSMPATIGVLTPKRFTTRGATTTISSMIAAVIGSRAAPPSKAP